MSLKISYYSQESNFIKKRLQHSFFLVNIEIFLRTTILKNNCEQLLLYFWWLLLLCMQLFIIDLLPRLFKCARFLVFFNRGGDHKLYYKGGKNLMGHLNIVSYSPSTLNQYWTDYDFGCRTSVFYSWTFSLTWKMGERRIWKLSHNLFPSLSEILIAIEHVWIN